jgi:hypothetical protein
MVTLKNDYHNTSAHVRVAWDEHGTYTLTPSQYRRVHRTLCDDSTCTCGTVRGPQAVEVESVQDPTTGEYSYQLTREIDREALDHDLALWAAFVDLALDDAAEKACYRLSL